MRGYVAALPLFASGAQKAEGLSFKCVIQGEHKLAWAKSQFDSGQISGAVVVVYGLPIFRNRRPKWPRYTGLRGGALTMIYLFGMVLNNNYSK